LPHTDDPADAAARLEEALERIAALADEVLSAREPVPPQDETVDAAAVAQRLDALIATVRAALARRPA
jgi:hypothetical protein